MNNWSKRFVNVLGQQMAYVESGSGDPLLFLHGNPTSSYLWRNIMPDLSDLGHCIAPDLIGMGDSDKLPDSAPGRYDFSTHANHIDAFCNELGINENVTLILHDWGSALGMDWAYRHPAAIRGIAYMEAFVRPLKWSEWPEPSRSIFSGLRSAAGETLILEKNVFVERILPASVLRDLSADEMREYRRPFLSPGESRRPTLDWPRQIPFDGEPAAVHALVSSYAEWMSGNNIPKLFINAEPGAILVGPQREYCRQWRNQTEVTVAGIHFIQEDSPGEISAALRSWIQGL